MNRPFRQRIPAPTRLHLALPRIRGFTRKHKRRVIRAADDGLSQHLVAVVHVVHGVCEGAAVEEGEERGAEVHLGRRGVSWRGGGEGIGEEWG